MTSLCQLFLRERVQFNQGLMNCGEHISSLVTWYDSNELGGCLRTTGHLKTFENMHRRFTKDEQHI